MNKCPQCQLEVDMNVSVCPLCGTALLQDGKPGTSMRPLYPHFVSFDQVKQERFTILARIFFMASILCGGASLLVNIFTWNGIPWCLAAIGGILTAWLLVGLPLLGNMNINHMLILQTIGVSVYLWLLDLLFGNLGWALNYVIPLLYVLMACVVAIFVLVFRNVWREYLITLISMAMLGFIFLIIIFTHKVSVSWPSWMAVFFALLLILGMLTFAKKKMGTELRRRMDL